MVSVGWFGARFGEIAERFGAKVTWLKVVWGKAATPELAEAAKKVGLLVSAVFPCCFNPAIGRRCPDLTVQNALGDKRMTVG